MENRLIMLPQPILVSDEKIKGGDFYFKDGKVLQWVKGTSVTYTHVHPSNYPKPIVAGLPDLPKLDLSLIAEEIGWVDVEKLAESHYRHWYTEYDVGRSYRGFIHGFKAAQSLNEKKFSEGDMIDAFYAGQQRHDLFEAADYLATLKPKEYLVEVEMEDMLQTRHGDQWYDLPNQKEGREPDGIYQTVKRIKITNNTIKLTKILK